MPDKSADFGLKPGGKAYRPDLLCCGPLPLLFKIFFAKFID
jgi:hypothetical protein